MSLVVFFFFKQKTAYEMRISDWSSDVCSSDLLVAVRAGDITQVGPWHVKLDTIEPVAGPNWTALEARLLVRYGPGGKVTRMARSEERRVGKGGSVRVDLGGRRIIKKKNRQQTVLTLVYQDKQEIRINKK